jgi:hypothetical protein
MKGRSIGKRIALALAAIAIGCLVWIIWSSFLPTTENVYKVLQTVVGLGVMIYLTYRWSGKTIALVVAIVFIGLVIWAMVTGLML